MQQISEFIGGNLVERYDAVIRNTAAIAQKLGRLSANDPAVQDKIKCLKYQLECANKGSQRLSETIRASL